MQKYIFPLLLSLLTACQPANQGHESYADDTYEEIVGGNTVSSSDGIAKHLVFIYSERDYSYCTGTIIGPHLILTAAHCIRDPSERMAIGFGVNYANGSMEVRYSNGSYIHSQFQRTANQERNDLALLSFSGSLPDGFSPAPLANAKIMAKANAEIIAVGYGRVTGAPASSKDSGYGRLRKVAVKIAGQSPNKKIFSVNQKDARGTCYGDSGGPAFIKSNGSYYLVGVISALTWLPGKKSNVDLCKEHSLFMDVHTYLPWITGNSSKLR